MASFSIRYDNFFELRGWICWKQDLRCKQLEEVKIKPADQISLLKDIGLIDQAVYIRFDYLRDVCNRGSHTGNEVEENEALEAQGFVEDLLQNFKQYYSNLAAAFDAPEWHQIKVSQSIATTKYSMRLSDDIDFLEEQNEKTQNYIDRKSPVWQIRTLDESESALNQKLTLRKIKLLSAKKKLIQSPLPTFSLFRIASFFSRFMTQKATST